MAGERQQSQSAAAPRLLILPGALARWRDWLPPAIAAAVAALAALYYVRSPGVLRPVFDDSYISLQFARNLAEHGKLTFDGQEWSTGATSLLHVVLLAVPIRLGMDPFSADVGFGVICHPLLAVAVYWLGLAVFRSRPAAFSGALLIAVLNYAAFDAGNGMETTLFMALLAASMAGVLSPGFAKRPLATGGLIALALLTRPEGAILVPAAIVYRTLNREPEEGLGELAGQAALLAAPAVAVLIGESLFAYAVTGSLAPGTATAKLHFFQEVGLPLRTKFNLAGDFIGLYAGPLIAPLVFAAIAVRRRESVLFGLFFGPFYAAYLLFFPGGLAHYFYRYQHPLLPIVAVLAGGGVALLVEEALHRGLLAKTLVLGALVFLAVPVFSYFQHWRILYRDASFETLVDLEGMARDLNTVVGPDQVVATHDIGAVGYFANYRVLDLVGLANPDVIRYHDGNRVSTYIDRVRPDYVLIFPEWDYSYLHLFADDHPEKYELVKVYPGRNIRRQPYVLYRVHYPLQP